MSKKLAPVKSKADDAGVTGDPGRLLVEVREVIDDEARRGAAVAVHAGLSEMYWRIGQSIPTEVLGGQRASDGAEIVATLSRQLVDDYGPGSKQKSLRRMVQFSESYPEEQSVVSLIRHLSWPHYLGLPFKDPLTRDFYAQLGPT